MSYYSAILKNVSTLAEDWLSQEAFSWGALGISEGLDFHQPEGEEEITTLQKDLHQIQIYFASAPGPGFFQEVKARFPEVGIEVQEQPDQDWLAEWKKSFQPFELVPQVWVGPSWCEAPQEARQILRLDPGMAFGTGTHETTRLVAEALAPILRRMEAESLLDVGTGTGILAILAKQWGVRHVVATDIEKEARRVARENARDNNVDIQVLETQIDTVAERFDVVIANIIDGILVRLSTDLFRCLKPGGVLILSGIILEREEIFLSGFKLPSQYQWTQRIQKGDWLCFVAEDSNLGS